MPELPEVETIKRDLAQKIVGKKILDAHVWDSRVLRNCTAAAFSRNLLGRRIKDVARRGKAIILHFKEGGYLIVQPMMTGHFIFGTGSFETARTKATKISFRLSKGVHLNYNDHRLFGRINWVTDLEGFEFFRKLGPEPLESEFTTSWLGAALKKRAVPIKTLLLDQNFIAGIGNIYASEILFRSRIHPKRKARSLKGGEVELLHRRTIDVLNEAVKLRGTSMLTYLDASGRKGNFLKSIRVYGREDEACLTCRAPISKIIQGARSTFFCKNCQV